MTYCISAYLVSVAAGAAKTVAVKVPTNAVLEAASFVPDADVTANATNFGSLTLGANDGAGGAFGAIATAVTTETAGIDADTGVEFSITDAQLVAGQVVNLAKTYDGTGVAISGHLVLTLRRFA